MIRVLAFTTITALGVAAAWAEEPKADCSKFHRMSDGRWTSTIVSNIGNPKEYITLQPGIPIDRKLTVVGINVSATIDALCGGR